jgi:phosphatidylserine/phosphatidylglycerophosphate/cardiolipin synthase-like enzyme
MIRIHAKCVIADQRQALITSANFTEAAQKRNIEVGLLVTHYPTVSRLAAYLFGLREKECLIKCPKELLL